MIPVIGIYEQITFVVMRSSLAMQIKTPEHLACKRIQKAYACAFAPYKISLSCCFCWAVKLVGYLILTPTMKSPL